MALLRTSPDRFRLVPAICFLVFLLLGLFIYRDYGISWDESVNRDLNGYLNLRLIIRGDAQPLLDNSERYHGPAFEIVLVLVERVFRLKDDRQIYLARHLVTFLLFFAAVVVFYRLLRRRFASRLAGGVGALFLVLSPRIFADAFYNSKDLAFLNGFLFGLATLQRFLRKMDWRSASLHALSCAFMIDIRLMGVIIPALTFAVAAGVCLASLRHRPAVQPRLVPLLVNAVALIAFTILFWPVLWRDPVLHFRQAWEEMSRYPWEGNVLYRGEQVPATGLPWHYISVWMLLTTPLLYTGFFGIGAARFLSDFLRQPIRFVAEHPFDLAIVIALVAPPIAVVALHSVVYDGWRHMYFIYPPFLFLAVLGFVTALGWVRTRAAAFRPALALFVLATVLPLTATAWIMVRDHPHQYVYFNRLAGPSLEEIKQRYELDYWGVSCRQGLEFLVRYDDAPIIRVHACTLPGRFNSFLLTWPERRRLQFVDKVEDANYIVSHFRGQPGDVPPGKEVYAVRVRDAKLMVVHKVHQNAADSCAAVGSSDYGDE
jgi:hypothetical protein